MEFPVLSLKATDLPLIAILGFLEVVLSVDNALVLAMMAHHLPKQQQRRALTYGLVGAVAFRLACLAFASAMIGSTWIKFVGGGYLIFLALKHFFSRSDDKTEGHPKRVRSFWMTVLMIELMDIAFAVDSILAAVALSTNLLVVFLGGIIGVLVIRFAANGVIKVLDRFPRFELTAYILVLIIGLKVVIDAFEIPGVDFHSPSAPSFWAFWAVMILTIGTGFLGKRRA